MGEEQEEEGVYEDDGTTLTADQQDEVDALQVRGGPQEDAGLLLTSVCSALHCRKGARRREAAR